MKWDQGLLTLLLIVGVTLVGVAACGPSRSEVQMLQRPRSVRALDACVAKLGRHDKLVGGEKQKIEIPVCQVALDGNSKEVRPLLVPVGYTLSPKEKGQAVIKLDILLSIHQAKKEAAATAAAKRIALNCGPKIESLWKKSGLGGELSLQITAFTDTNYDNEHVIYVDGDPESDEGLSMAQWPQRSRYYNGYRKGDARHCVESVPSRDLPRRTKCERDALRKSADETDLFCQDLAIMSAHFLGLAADDAKEGRCDATPATGASPAPSATPAARATSFMRAALDPVNRGPLFWDKVRFTDADRRTIFAPACTPEASSAPIAKN